jgi:hypothetical protein
VAARKTRKEAMASADDESSAQLFRKDYNATHIIVSAPIVVVTIDYLASS